MIDWKNIQILAITRWMDHDDSCPGLTLLDKRCECGLLDKLKQLGYPSVEQDPDMVLDSDWMSKHFEKAPAGWGEHWLIPDTNGGAWLQWRGKIAGGGYELVIPAMIPKLYIFTTRIVCHTRGDIHGLLEMLKVSLTT